MFGRAMTRLRVYHVPSQLRLEASLPQACDVPAAQHLLGRGGNAVQRNQPICVLGDGATRVGLHNRAPNLENVLLAFMLLTPGPLLLLRFLLLSDAKDSRRLGCRERCSHARGIALARLELIALLHQLVPREVQDARGKQPLPEDPRPHVERRVLKAGPPSVEVGEIVIFFSSPHVEPDEARLHGPGVTLSEQASSAVGRGGGGNVSVRVSVHRSHEEGLALPVLARVLDDAEAVDPNILNLEPARDLDGVLESLDQ